MTSIIYPITPSSGGAPPPVFNGSNNGLVPNPGAGVAGRVLHASGAWLVPSIAAAAPTLVLNPSVTSGVLGSVTWSTNWVDPITLSTSIPMAVARMNSNLYQTGLGANQVETLISSGSSQMFTRNRWGSNISSIIFGLYSPNWNCDFYGTILVNGSWFQVMGGASLSTNNSDLLITKLT